MGFRAQPLAGPEKRTKQKILTSPEGHGNVYALKKQTLFGRYHCINSLI